MDQHNLHTDAPSSAVPELPGAADMTPNLALILRKLRIIWAALLAGPLFFLFMLVFVLANATGPAPIPPAAAVRLEWFAAVFIVIAALAAFIVRKMIFSSAIKKTGDLTMQAYISGTLIFLAMCEGASFFGLVCVLKTHAWWPTVLVPAAAMALQAVNFPTGGPLRAQLTSASDNSQ